MEYTDSQFQKLRNDAAKTPSSKFALFMRDAQNLSFKTKRNSYLDKWEVFLMGLSVSDILAGKTNVVAYNRAKKR